MMFVDDLATDFNSVHFKNKRYNKLQRRKMLKQAHTYDKNKIEDFSQMGLSHAELLCTLSEDMYSCFVLH